MKHKIPIVAALVLIPWSAFAGGLAPERLRCEYLEDPLGIDVTEPRLSWELRATNEDARGLRQIAYQVQVASSPEVLAAGDADLWESGKVISDETIGIIYAGEKLASRDRCHWRVRVWDQDGEPSAWSEPAMWTMGLLDPEAWQAQWIADPVAVKRNIELPCYGWLNVPLQHADVPADDPEISQTKKASEHGQDDPVWLEIDLRKVHTIDTVVFHPTRDLQQYPNEPSHVFPLRFQIKVSPTADRGQATIVVDRTAADEPDPGRDSVSYRFAPIKARFVRVQFTKLRKIRMDYFGAALSEIEIYSDGENVARGAVVFASRTLKGSQWSPGYLVDGKTQPVAGNFREFKPVMLRKEFAIRPAVRRATAYVTAKGIYELHLNGQPAGDGRVLAPEWTDYRHRIQYQTYDITPLIKEGRNAVGVVLSPGWYCGHLGHSPPLHRFTYGNFPQLLTQIEVEYADGSQDTIVTDDSWQISDDGPYVYSDFIDGQTYDARREMPGWDRIGFRADDWRAVVTNPADTEWLWWNGRTGESEIRTREATEPRLVAQMNEPIRVVRELNPLAISEPKPGVFVFDLGQNIAGWCRLKLRAPAGTAVRLRHAEVLQPDGMVYVSNLRTAQATDTYLARGGGEETFEPQMTQHGFRYVEVTGLAKRPQREDLVGCVVRSSAPIVGTFESSDPMLNRIMAAMRWTIEDNMLCVPTDCPQRDERMGWGGDGQFAAPAASYFMGMGRFYRKWVTDFRDGQFADGRFPHLAPKVYWDHFGPGWSDAGVTVPWLVYVNDGDRRQLEEHFDAARRWVDYVQAANPDGVYRNQRGGDWGDWLNGDTLLLQGWPTEGGSVPKELWATVLWAHSTELIAKMAEVLGDQESVKTYRDRHAKIKAAFGREFLTADGRLTGDTQAGYALALRYGLIDPPLRERTVARLQESVERRGGHPTAGITAVLPLFEALSQNGLHDEARRMIALRTPPSFGYMIEQGGTTIWERWDGYIEGRGFGHPKMNSFNHPALASVAAWIWRHIAGIQADETRPGFKHFFIAPQLGGDLSWMKAGYDSVRGRIECAYEIKDGKLTLRVTVPPNTTATVVLPEGFRQDIALDGIPAKRPTMELPSGRYRISSHSGSQ
ncbi:MAG: family 78 glycoside hydrolase catalytic domain, partial [Planctomycetota bacterium]